MEKRANIAALIEKNRIALLRMVFCWLTTAYCINARGDKPLPKRIARWVNALVSKAENAAGYLLIAIHYHSQIKRQRSIAFDKTAMRFVCSHRGAMTLIHLKRRLKALQSTLHNLHAVARRLSKSVAARARVEALKAVAFSGACGASSRAMSMHNYAPTRPKPVPP